MQIYINDQMLDAELSGEKNVSEVYEQVNKWSSEHKKFILELKVNKEEVSLGNLDSIPVDNVERLDFYVGDEMEIVLTTVDELDQYIDKAGSALFEMEQVTDKDVLDLKEGVHWIRQIMSSLSSILHMDLNALNPEFAIKGGEDSQSVEEILIHLETIVEDFNSENIKGQIEKFLQYLRKLKHFVMKLQMQLKAMHADTAELLDIIKEFESEIENVCNEAIEINSGFNAGKDREALDNLDRYLEKINVYISALYALDYKSNLESERSIMHHEKNGEPFHIHVSALTELLHDLSSALEENDIVAAGDILEYELTEKLQLLIPYLSGIRHLMVAGKQG